MNYTNHDRLAVSLYGEAAFFLYPESFEIGSHP